MVGGFIIRSWDGRFIRAGTTNLQVASGLVAESTTMHNGVHVIIQAEYRSIVLKGDNQVLIKAIKGDIHIPFEMQTLVEDTKDLLQLLHLSLHPTYFLRRKSSNRLISQICPYYFLFYFVFLSLICYFFSSSLRTTR